MCAIVVSPSLSFLAAYSDTNGKGLDPFTFVLPRRLPWQRATTTTTVVGRRWCDGGNMRDIYWRFRTKLPENCLVLLVIRSELTLCYRSLREPPTRADGCCELSLQPQVPC